ncbi:MAG: PAS domain S-box protein, partial [bacterium]
LLGKNGMGNIIPSLESTGRDLQEMVTNLCLNPENFIENENENIRKNGERVWVAWRNKGIYGDNGNFAGLLCTGYDITKRKQAEAVIIRERDFVAAILQWIESIVVVIDPDGYIHQFNKAAEKCSGYTLEEVQQHPFWEILIPPGEQQAVKDIILNLRTKPLSTEHQNYWITKDGGKRLIHWFNTILTGPDRSIEFVLCTGLDLTDHHQVKEALRRSEEHYQSVLENMEEGYFEIDLAGSYTAVNKSLAKTLGYPETELKGLNYRTYMDTKTAARVFVMYNTIYRTGQPKTYMLYDVIRRDGETRTLEVSSSLSRDVDEMPNGFYGIVRDVTDRIRIEKMMIQTEKMMSVGGLAAGMAHELNNPLAAMLQGSQNILRRLSPDLPSNLEPARAAGIDLQKLQHYMEDREILSFINGIRESGIKASKIISNMLQFSRKSESKMAPTNLVALLENVLELASKDYNLKKKFDFRTIKLLKDYSPHMPLVPCTETEIEQVILNLLNNATWSMANQPGNTAPQIILRVHAEQKMARIEVEDNGPGIEAEIKKRIFEPFFTTKPVGEGTGLGLSVSYMIITNNHLGTMEVESEIGQGTRFIIRIPLNRESTS